MIPGLLLFLFLSVTFLFVLFGQCYINNVYYYIYTFYSTTSFLTVVETVSLHITQIISHIKHMLL